MDGYDRKILDAGTEKLLAELFLKILSINAEYILCSDEKFRYSPNRGYQMP